jgi:hypothetical protein
MFTNRRIATLVGTVITGAAFGLAALATAGTAAAERNPSSTKGSIVWGDLPNENNPSSIFKHQAQTNGQQSAAPGSDGYDGRGHHGGR